MRKLLWYVVVACSAAVAALAAQPAVGQAGYPSRPIRLIVPFPAGGGTDIFARTIAAKLTERLGWTVVVDNKPGAGGNIGVDAAAKAPADGYTLVLGQTSNLAINPTLYKKLPYDPLKDLSPIVLVADAPLALAVPAQSPFKTLSDLVAAARKNPGEISFGSPGNGTVAHLTIALFQNAAGVKFQHIPYKGSAQALTDLLGGSTQVYMSSVPTILGHVRSGKMRVLGVTSKGRIATLPDVPTIAESGYGGFDATTWFGLLAPAGTPEALIAKVNLEVNQILKLPDAREKIAGEGGVALGGTPAEFAALLRAEVPRWGKVVVESGAKVD